MEVGSHSLDMAAARQAEARLALVRARTGTALADTGPADSLVDTRAAGTLPLPEGSSVGSGGTSLAEEVPLTL